MSTAALFTAAARWNHPNVRWRMNKQNVIHLYTGTFSSRKKEWSTDACHDLGEPWEHLVKENKPVTKGHMFSDSIYYEMSRRGRSIEMREDEWLSGAGRLGGKGVAAKGYRFIFEVMKMS